ncbi:MAG: hypothetical protein WCI63_02990 [bacterium]
MTEEKFVKQLEKLFTAEGFLTRKEIGAGFGVADLVLVRINSDKISKRQKNKQFDPLFKESYFNILKALPDIDKTCRPIGIDKISAKTGIGRAKLKNKLLVELEGKGYVKKVDGELFFKINGWMPIAKEVIAIEAKLENWKRGLLQANRYKSFADKVYLAVPEGIAHRVDKKFLNSQNIGLITYDSKTNTINEVCKPKSERPSFEHKRNLVSEFFLEYV